MVRNVLSCVFSLNPKYLVSESPGGDIATPALEPAVPTQETYAPALQEILDRSNIATQIMAIFRERENGQLETGKILAEIGCTREGLNHVLQQLIEGGHIERVKRGVYQRLDDKVKAEFVLSS